MPFDQGQNAYTLRMREILGWIGPVQPCPRGLELLKVSIGFSQGSVEVAFLNWVDNDLVNQRGNVSISGIAKTLVRLACLRRYAKKVIFVRHNVFPHRTKAGQAWLARRLVDVLEAACDVSITHSGASIAPNRLYCPYPLYRAVDRLDSVVPDRYRVAGDYFVVFGRIEPYKEIEALIEAFPSDRNLLVFGAFRDQAYAARLLAMQRNNIRVVPGFVPETLAQNLVARSLGLIIAHADKDMIVSASLFYGLSVGAPVYALETPFVEWIRGRLPAYLVTSAPTIVELCRALRSSGEPRDRPKRMDAFLEQEFGDEAVYQALIRSMGRNYRSSRALRRSHQSQ